MSDDGPQVPRCERDRSPLLIIALALLIQGLAVGLLVGAGALDRHQRVVGQASSLGGSRPIEHLGAVIHDPAIMAHVGRQVALRDVRVDAVVGDAVFWISKEGERMPVLLLGERTGRQAEGHVEVEQGDLLRIFGDLRRTEGSRQLLGSSLLDETERERLQDSPVFISAESVTVTRKAERKPMARQLR